MNNFDYLIMFSCNKAKYK